MKQMHVRINSPSETVIPSDLEATARIVGTCKPQEITVKFHMGDALLRSEKQMASEKGAFTRWLTATCNMSRAAATNLMRIAALVAPVDRDVVAEMFDLGALYELTRTDQGRAALPRAINAARHGDRITVTIAKKLITSESKVRRENSVVILPDAVRIECCNIGELKVEAESVDMILTDPPYDEASVRLYEEVAKLGARCLRPGGWCLAYTGKMYLARIHYWMKKHLTYTFQFDVPHKKPTLIKSLGIQQNAKYIVGYRYQPGKPWWEPVSDRISGKLEKKLHKWQQPIEEAEQLISGLCPEGGVVLDPMCGSGTSLAAALKLGRQGIGADVDPEAVRITKERLAEMASSLRGDNE